MNKGSKIVSVSYLQSPEFCVWHIWLKYIQNTDFLSGKNYSYSYPPPNDSSLEASVFVR